MMLRIDSHHHLWDYNREDYPWIDESKQILRRNFSGKDLLPEIAASGVNATIAVQAAQTLNETRFLLDAAKQYSFIKGVVGWVPLTEEDLELDLEHFSKNKKLRGIRHVLHDEPNERYMLRDDFNRGIRNLLKFDLAYDILIFERHLPQTLAFVDKHPDQRFILDHLAKPRIKESQMSPWREKLTELAKRPHVYCKLSGLATEADHNDWTKGQLRPYIDVVLRAFEPRRVMFGSDWPVCLLAIGYKAWFDLVSEGLATLSGEEQARVWSGTAIEAYKLDV